MKRILLTLALLLLPSLASAQCNGVFANNTVCGNITGASNTPRPTNPSAFLGAAGGANGQIQYNNGGALGGFTPGGDLSFANPNFTIVNGAVTTAKIAAKSGNGTTVATTTGSQTSGDCVNIDANGNHIASGYPCGAAKVIAPTGGDSTAAIQNAINATTNTVLLSCGTYTISSTITIPSGGASIEGVNNSCVSIVLTGNFFAITCTSIANRVNIANLKFTGTAANFNGTLNISNLNQGAITTVDCPQVTGQNLLINNMSGTGISCTNPSGSFGTVASLVFDRISVFNSYYGIHPADACEYVLFTNITARNNIYGALIESGNVNLSSFQMSFNYNNIQVIGRTNNNPCHGVIGNGSANHAFSVNFQVISCPNGFTAINVNFIGDNGGSLTSGGGLIYIANSRGVTISGGQMGSNIQVVQADPVGGSTARAGSNTLIGTYVRDDIAGFTNPALYTASALQIKLNYTTAGQWAQNN